MNGKEIVQLKVALKKTEPLVWRRILVKSDVTFFELHHILQLTMGWENLHLYEFNVGEYHIGLPDEEFGDLGISSKMIDAREIRLHEIVSSGTKKFSYEYDFGDGWAHEISIEKSLSENPDFLYPYCVAGEMNCPPEGCGGISGYYELWEIMKNKTHPEHENMVEWLGEEYDPFEFDPEDVNFEMEEIEHFKQQTHELVKMVSETVFPFSWPIKIVNKSKHPLPSYESEASAGMDLRANLEKEITLKPLERSIVKTGLFIELPIGFEAQVRPRSGLAAKHGITVLNSPGTIDADYRGEIGVILVNLSNENFTIKNGERIAQLVITRHERAQWEEVKKLGETKRGEGGFGSTGK